MRVPGLGDAAKSEPQRAEAGVKPGLQQARVNSCASRFAAVPRHHCLVPFPIRGCTPASLRSCSSLRTSKPLLDYGILVLNLQPGGMLMTKDPVCKMDVDEKKTNFSSEYAGRKFHFCSEECKDTFDSQPERYATSAA